MCLTVSIPSPHWWQCVSPALPMQFALNERVLMQSSWAAKIRASVVLLSWPFVNHRTDKVSFRAAWRCMSLMNFPWCCLEAAFEKSCASCAFWSSRMTFFRLRGGFSGFCLLMVTNWRSSFPPTAVDACTPQPWLDLRSSRGKLLGSPLPTPRSAGNSWVPYLPASGEDTTSLERRSDDALVPFQDFQCEHIQVPQLSPSPLHSHEPIPQKRYGQGVCGIDFVTWVQLGLPNLVEPLLVLSNHRVLHLLVESVANSCSTPRYR